jgi:hypothetical protein
MPNPDAVGDAAYVAIAAANGNSYLLTRKVLHLANVNKVEHLRGMLGREGYEAPQIVTPELLWIWSDDQ